MKRFLPVSIVIFACLLAANAGAQSIASKYSQAVKLQHEYDFAAAADIYRSLVSGGDSVISARASLSLTQCENGESMLQFATEPALAGRKVVPAKDFFLWFSHLASGAWHTIPNPLTGGTGTSLPIATYLEDGAKTIIFSAPSENGDWDLYTSSLIADTLWSLPQPIEACNSDGNEVLPLLSADGGELYFASDGLAGAGGFDLFSSRWNARRKCWEAPVNLGFPYSSPFDDMLCSHTPDGLHTLLASNRDCVSDSICIYVFRFDPSPVKRPVNSSEARRIAKFLPAAAKPSTADTAELAATTEPVADSDISRRIASFREGMHRLETLRGELSDLRERRAKTSDTVEGKAIDEKTVILQQQLSELTGQVRRSEEELLALGVSHEQLQPRKTIVTPVVPESEIAPYQFSKNSWGAPLTTPVEQPVEEDPYDYTFSTTGGTTFVTDGTLPDGLIYQIQLSVSARKAAKRTFKGITPVFERRQPSGKYLYAAGAFRTYEEAEAALPKVKKAGFGQAFIIAVNDGHSINLKKARQIEKH